MKNKLITGQGIETKFIGPSNYRPARVKATAWWRKSSITISWDYGIDNENHARAAMALLQKLEMENYVLAARAETESGYVFTLQYKEGK